VDAPGSRDQAVDALRGAHEITHRLGANPMSAELAVVARKLHVRLGGSRASAPTTDASAFGLTPREREVLEQLTAGKTNKQIAEALFISASTAGVHVSNILSKLGVATRTEAASMALSQGLVRT
jgi:DNA-binding NarL/FixJ family response regulator